MWIERLTAYCLSNQIISEEDVPWFQYGIEKRCSTIFVAIPFVVLSAILSDLKIATTFILSFYCLRSRTNGYHAKTVWGCFLLSILHVLIFLGVVSPMLEGMVVNAISTAGTTIVYFLAPFNDTAMHLSEDEIIACRKGARVRVCCLWGCCIFLHILKAGDAAKGIALGIAMAAYLLCLAYIIERRKHK